MSLARVGPSKDRDRDRNISPPHQKRAPNRRLSKPANPKNVSARPASEDDEERPSKLTFYPAFCFPLSQTYSAWVKLSCADVHRLTTRRGFEGQRIYFLQNHPIRYIRLVGRIVACDEKPHAWIWYLDDGSGRNVEVFCKKTVSLPVSTAETKPTNGEAPSSIYNADIASIPLVTWPGQEITWRPPETYFSTTAVPSTNKSVAGSRYLCQTGTGNTLDTSTLRTGALVKIKGTIGEFAGEKQVLLERFWLLNSTTEEMHAWSELVAFRRTVLSKPWVVLSVDMQTLKRRAERKAGVSGSTTNGPKAKN